MKTILRAVITFFVCVCHTVLDTVSMLNKKWIPIFIGSRKAVTFSLLLATFSLFLAAPKTNAQTSVNNFADFIAITTTTNNYDISLTGDIFFSGGNFNVLSGTITGNGYVLDGQNVNAGVLLTSGNNLFFYGPITFQNFSKIVGSSGTAAQGGALFVAGAYNAYSDSTTILNFTNAIISFTSNTVRSGVNGAAAQGGGLFVGGVVSASAGIGANHSSSSGTAIVNFTSSTINFTSNTVASGNNGTVAQGGGLFVGGAVSAGTYSNGVNNSSGGTAIVNFTSSTINFTSNTLVVSGNTDGTAAQGGGLFVGGAVSAGTYGTGVSNSSNSTAIVNFILSTINFTSNTVTNTNQGTVAQGGGLFVGGAVAAGVRAGTNNASSATAIVNFTSSTINFAGNIAKSGSAATAAQGGGLFVGGAVAAGANDTTGTNNASSGTAIVNFVLSTINFTSNTVRGGDAGTAAQGGGLFVGGAVAAGGMGASKNFSSSGAAIVSFTSSTINFAGNMLIVDGSNGSSTQGGGLFVGGAVAASSYGNGVNNSSNSTAIVTFTDSKVNIDGNAAQDGGGMFISGSVSTGSFYGIGVATNGVAQVNFTGSTIAITGNVASVQGGGIYIAGNYGAGSSGGQASLIFENAQVSFTSNTATSGSAIYANNGSTVVFKNSDVKFIENVTIGATTENGGAVSVERRSKVIFSSGTTEFKDNTASRGSGVYVRSSSTVEFIYGDVKFDNSYIYVVMDSTISFSSSNVLLSNNNTGARATSVGSRAWFLVNSSTVEYVNNNSDNGAAIFLDSKGSAVFYRSNVNFSSNTADDSGGAIGSRYFSTGSGNMAFEGGVVNFNYNTAGSAGGAIYIAASSTMSFTGTTVTFQGNSARQGGAVNAVSNSSFIFTGGAVEFLWNNTTNGNGVVYWDTSSYVGLENAKITKAIGNQANNGGFLYLVNQGTWSFANIDMSSNTARSGYGGALYLNSATVVFSGTNTISYNTANSYGGAIQAFDTKNIDFSLATLKAEGNMSAAGGFLYAVNTGTITFGAAEFYANTTTASGSGGALYAGPNAQFNFIATTTTFENNMAGNVGGALYILNSTNGYIKSANTLVFKNNKQTAAGGAGGGAIYILSSLSTIFEAPVMNFDGNTAVGNGGAAMINLSAAQFLGSGEIKFSNNIAKGNGASAGGGALFLNGAQAYFDNREVTFYNNQSSPLNAGGQSGGGGALYLYSIATGTSAYVEFNGKTNFTSNTAVERGGAIAMHGQVKVSSAVFNEDVYFGYNSAANGVGGAISMIGPIGNKLVFNGNTTEFKGNEAKNAGWDGAVGGAISAGDASDSAVEFNSQITSFTANKAYGAGALNLTQSSVAFSKEVYFTSNAAKFAGGGVAVVKTGQSYIFGSTAVFSENTAATDGGALYNYQGIIETKGNTIFKGNKAQASAGAIYNYEGLVNLGGNVVFEANQAEVSGGALYADAAASEIQFADGSTITFKGNKATQNGGAIYATAGAKIVFSSGIAQLVVAGNTAAKGGFIAVENATATFDGGNFSFSNSTASISGGFLYAANNAIANFENIYASSNSAALGGFIAAESGAIINITGSTISANVATSSGGAIYLSNNSVANFNGDVLFATNTASFGGGAIYMENSSASFTANAIFDYNGSVSGAVMQAVNSQIYFTGVSSFTNNYNAGSEYNNTDRGAVYLLNSTATFNDTYFIGNTGAYYDIAGGALNSDNAIIQFLGNITVFAGNRARQANSAAYMLGAKVSNSTVLFKSTTTIFNGNSFWADNSTVTFSGNYVEFSSNNINNTSGGAIRSVNADILFENVQVVFNDNQARPGYMTPSEYSAYGGAIANIGGRISFVNAPVLFEGNVADIYSNAYSRNIFGGAIYNANGGIITIGSATFVGNVAYSSGGAVYNASIYNMETGIGDIIYEGNTAGFAGNDIYNIGTININGGAKGVYIYDGMYSSNIVNKYNAGVLYLSSGNYFSTIFNQSSGTTLIDKAEVTIENAVWNVATSSGVRVTTSAVTTTNTAVKFDKNINTDGGALYAYASTITFNGNTVIFESNTASNYGGALYAENSSVTFNNAQINFTSNAAVDGGAIYSNLANITFNNGNATFTNNKALTGSGGAIYAVDDLVFDGANVDFTGNEALSGNGGAIFADDTILTIKNAVMTFMNNKALLGGAVYASNNSNITLSGRGNFTGNEAATNGAAVYVTGGSTVTIEAANGDIIFSGNKAAGTPNDIYADNNSRLNLITSGTNTISIAGGILSNTAGTAIEVNKTGTGTLLLGSDNEVWGDFTATAGKVVLLESATFKANNIIFNGAELDMTDADLYDNLHVNVATATTMFASNTSLLMDIFKNGNNDQIFASSAQIGGNLQIKAHFGVYNNQEYHLIMSSENAINGTFANATFVYVGTGAFSYQVKYNDITDWTGVVRIIVNGINKGDFQNLPKLTFNQSEVAKTWDELSIILPTNDLEKIMEATANLSDQEEQKKVLAIASGYFHSNVIKSAALDSDNNELYDRIKNHSTREHTNSAIWAQVTGGNTKLGGDENSLGEYKDNRYGVMAGFDIYFGSMSSINKTMLGIYVNYKDQSMNQEASKATLNKIGGGLYGGYIEESYEIKAMIGGSKDSYETTRNIAISQYLPVPPYADRNAKANYEGFTLGADVEGALKYKIGNNTNFRPYAGAELKNVSYDGFTETGANGLNLKVEAGNYLRTTARVGAGVNYDDKTWAGYVNLEGKYLLTGKKYEIESVFEGTEVKFLSRGYEENGLILGATLGGSVRITEGLKFFINANAHTAEKFTNLYANAGLRYNFCGITHKEKEEPVPAPVVVVEQAKPEIIEQPKPAVEAGKKQIQPYRSRAVNFDTNKYLLKSNHIMSIKEHAEYIKQHEYKKITIEGHTDSTGNEKVNQPLSERRAQSVYNELANNGIPKEKMEIVGHSSKNPVDTNKTKEGRANNRRVEIFVE
ncbi:OmpA family protein [Endomicrobium proavitum]|uniref:Outer membrane protein and related peptidoglycan-associated (Lipo)proteins n=1 Tax=Endomicrobium proavitum TaxID=1408281 RepID=A0A0G3WHK2_9BACT|nr:OmpA family protein [Endomicrobium proavitum]AKL97380.1 outer membrane protein and related peptidoglycan-associated (lipo)proteins [Endomicrobium proavitum]